MYHRDETDDVRLSPHERMPTIIDQMSSGDASTPIHTSSTLVEIGAVASGPPGDCPCDCLRCTVLVWSVFRGGL